jgi:hypothetical protein
MVGVGNAQAGGEAGQGVRSRYEITWPFVVISLRLLMPFRNFSDQVIL